MRGDKVAVDLDVGVGDGQEPYPDLRRNGTKEMINLA